MKKAKKQLKKRFAVEVTEETRLFFISSFQRNLYNQRDIHNLAWLISVINPRETEYKKTHPFLLIDWLESQ
jgi:ribosome biogenesis protein BMS1